MESENNGEIRDHKGKFLPGNPGKPKGAASNSSARVKDAILQFLDRNIDAVQDSFDSLKPIEKLQFITAIIPYAVPKLQNIQSEIEQKTEHSGKLTIEIIKPTSETP